MATKQTTIGSLRVQLGLDTAELDKNLSAAGSRLGKFSNDFAKIGLAMGAALTGAATAMGVAVKKSIDAADEMGEMAEKVGMAVAALSKLSYAAEVNGVSSETLEKGLKRLAQAMTDVRDGAGGGAAQALAKLGVGVTDATGAFRDSEAVMTDLIGRFGELPNGVEKTALAMDIFGKSGADMIPLLNAGAEGFAELSAEAAALGLVIDDKTAQSAARFNDNMTRLGQVFGGITTQMASALAPAMANVSDMLVDAAKNTKLMDSVTRGLDGAFKIVVSGAIVAGGVVKFVADTLGSLAKILMQVYGRDFRGALTTWNGMFSQTFDTAKGTALAIKEVWTGVGDGVAASAKTALDRGVKPAAAGAADAVAKAADAAAKALEDLERRLDRVRDGTLAPQERRAKRIREDVQVVQDAFAKGLIDAEEMHALIEKMGGGLKLISAPIIEDLTKLGEVQVDAPMDRLRNKAEEISEAFAQVAWSVDGIAFALKNNDWAGAARGLMAVISQIGAAYKANGIAGAGSVALQAAGQATGGVTGSTLSGAGSGMALGATLGGPVGAVIGAILGGVMGNRAGTKAKKEEAQRQALEAYNKQMEILAQRRALELRIMELQGNAAGALAAARADELAAMDAESRALQAQIYALEDKAELEAKRASFDAAFRSDAEAMAGIMGEVAGELARLGYTGVTTRDQFKALVLGLDQTTDAGAATYRALLDVAPKFLEVADYLDQVRASAEGQVEAARQTLIAAYEQEAGALRGVIDKFRAFATTLRQFRDSLLAGPAAQLSPGAQYRVTRNQFEGARRRAMSGDEDALAALPGYAEAFLDSARAIAPDAASYARDLAAVRNAVQAAESIASGEADTALAQLAAMEAQVGQLVQLNAGMMSVAEAIAGLAEAQAGAAAQIAAAMAQAVAVTQIPAAPPASTPPKVWTPEGYMAANPDVAAWAPTAIGQKGYDGVLITSIDQALAYHWRHHGAAAGRGFANGGSFTVGGFGGTDSQFMPLMLTPGEMVDVRRPGAMRDRDGALEGALMALHGAVVQSAVTGREVENLLKRFDRNGLFVRGGAPDLPVAVNMD
jgi:hypothetical protein